MIDYDIEKEKAVLTCDKCYKVATYYGMQHEITNNVKRLGWAVRSGKSSFSESILCPKCFKKRKKLQMDKFKKLMDRIQ